MKQIIGSFEDIGKDIVKQTAKLPGDVLGKALESLGTQQQKNPQAASVPQDGNSGEPKKIPPRQWLEELAGKKPKPKEPTVQERLAKEKQQEEEKNAKAAQKLAPLAEPKTKAKRGNLYGVKQKTSSEMSKNVRQD